jgi:hypothetical protein
MSRLAFIDTETTSLRPDRRAWEIGVIIREDDGSERELRWFVELDDLDLGNADVRALEIGRFYQRHPGKFAGSPNGPEGWVMECVEEVTRGAHLVGAVVSFDADVLGQRMRANGICPSWHYHLVDVEALAAGALGVGPPWDSDDLSAAVGVKVSEDDRHTALGDARWARAIYDAVILGKDGSNIQK